MKIVVFSTKSYDRRFLGAAASELGHELTYLEARLSSETADLAKGFTAVCAFVNDRLDALVLQSLASHGVKVVALRCAGIRRFAATLRRVRHPLPGTGSVVTK